MSTADQSPPAGVGGSPWFAVVGPPGSGGEVIARALAALGLGLVESDPSPVSLEPPVAGERDGATMLSTAGDELLGLLEGTWWAPPDRPTGWEERRELLDAAIPVVASLETVLRHARCPAASDDPTRSAAVWYDVRHALLLPFWRARHRGLRAVVVTWRSPGATVAELAGQDIRPLHALALWEMQLVGALAAAEGMPVLGVDVDAALADPGDWAATAARFVEGLGLAGAGAEVEEVGIELRASAGRLAIPGLPPDLEETASAVRMAGWLASVAGPHHRWDSPVDLAVGRWAGALLDAQLAGHRSATSAADAWAAAEGALRDAASAGRDAASAVDALDWTVDRLVEGWASGRLTDGGAPTLPD